MTLFFSGRDSSDNNLVIPDEELVSENTVESGRNLPLIGNRRFQDPLPHTIIERPRNEEENDENIPLDAIQAPVDYGLPPPMDDDDDGEGGEDESPR